MNEIPIEPKIMKDTRQSKEIFDLYFGQSIYVSVFFCFFSFDWSLLSLISHTSVSFIHSLFNVSLIWVSGLVFSTVFTLVSFSQLYLLNPDPLTPCLSKRVILADPIVLLEEPLYISNPIKICVPSSFSCAF